PGRINPGHVEASPRKLESEGARAASDVEDVVCAELVGDGHVDVEVAAIGVEEVVERGQTRIFEREIRHGAPDDTCLPRHDLEARYRLMLARRARRRTARPTARSFDLCRSSGNARRRR